MSITPEEYRTTRYTRWQNIIKDTRPEDIKEDYCWLLKVNEETVTLCEDRREDRERQHISMLGLSKVFNTVFITADEGADLNFIIIKKCLEEQKKAFQALGGAIQETLKDEDGKWWDKNTLDSLSYLEIYRIFQSKTILPIRVRLQYSPCMHYCITKAQVVSPDQKGGRGWTMYRKEELLNDIILDTTHEVYPRNWVNPKRLSEESYKQLERLSEWKPNIYRLDDMRERIDIAIIEERANRLGTGRWW